MDRLSLLKKIKGTIKRNLLAMGLLPGDEVKIECVAPFGDPIDIVIKGYHLSLRKEEAENVIIDGGENA